MATKHRYGSPERFNAVADFIAAHYKNVKYVADVAGGQGMLSRLLNKKGFESEVIDPRGWTMVGVNGRQEEYESDMADFYDLVVGLHPDEALRPVVESAKVRPILVIPCCNFWDRDRKLGRNALLQEIEEYMKQNNIIFERVEFDFQGPQNIGIVTYGK